MTQDIRDVLKLALEALEVATTPLAKDRQEVLRAITAIKEALAQTQEPVAWLSTDSIGERHLCFDKPLDNDPVQPLYTHPPQRSESFGKPSAWVGLTDEEICTFSMWLDDKSDVAVFTAIEAKLKEKNT